MSLSVILALSEPIIQFLIVIVGFATCFVCRLILRASEDHWQGSLNIMYLDGSSLPSHSIYTLHHNSCNLSCFMQVVPWLTLETLKSEQFTLHLPMNLMTLWVPDRS